MTAPAAVARLRSPGRWLTPLGWLVLLGIVGLLSAILVVRREGSPDAARAVARAELAAMLEGGEVVLASAPVTQRLWWDYYRRTYGLLIATDRRLLFLGVPPEPLLHRDAGPRELVDVSFRYARGVGVRRSPGRGGMQVALASGSQREVIEGSGRDADALASVLDSMDARIAGLRAASDAERRAVEAAAAASRRAAYHLVQPGEALDAIARRYGTTTDSLLTWNNLTTSRIVAGQRLLVRPATTS